MKIKAILMIFMVLIVVGCGKQEDTPPAQTTPAESPEQTPTQTPEETPQPTPSQTPEEVPEPTPSQTPEMTPQETPEESPDAEKPAFGSWEHTIYINRKSFSEETAMVHEDTTVIWVNNDTKSHVIVIKTPFYLKGERLLNKGDSWNYTFDEMGEYEYVEAIFGINGKLIVNFENNE